MSLDNEQLAELLAREAEHHDDQRRRALRRAARWALAWPEHARGLAARGRPLTTLRAVGPWIARFIDAWLDDPPEIPDPPAIRRGFFSRARARDALAADDSAADALGDLQTHTVFSDGTASIEEMARAAAVLGRRWLLITDHSKGLPIANGMDEQRLDEQRAAVAAADALLDDITVLHGIEMNLSITGEGDMQPGALASLDVVLGAFHWQLRRTEDQTERYLAAVRNPLIHVLAHPRCRMFNRRAGLRAEWARVFGEAAASRTAIEIDAYPDRQDIDLELLEVARAEGATISIGTDAHAPDELAFLDLGLGAALLAGIPRERILNFLTPEQLRAWTQDR